VVPWRTEEIRFKMERKGEFGCGNWWPEEIRSKMERNVTVSIENHNQSHVTGFYWCLSLMMVFNRNRSQIFSSKCGPIVRFRRLQYLLAGGLCTNVRFLYSRSQHKGKHSNVGTLTYPTNPYMFQLRGAGVYLVVIGVTPVSWYV